MTRHAGALFLADDRGRLLGINSFEGRPAPRLWLGRTAEGNLWRIRADVPESLAARLEDLCAREPPLAEPEATPHSRDALCDLLDASDPVTTEWHGPAFALLQDTCEPQKALQVIEITKKNARLLDGTLDEWRVDIGNSNPLVAVLAEGRAVSICASVRISEEAHEAGVETIESARRKGYAFMAVTAWAAKVRALGALSLYSTSWDNKASQATATRLGAHFYGTDYCVT